MAGVGVSYVVYFRDSEECLRCIRRRAASESEARLWFARMGITVVAISVELG
jgi:hypothetical protein